MSDINSVVVTEVTSGNIQRIWPDILSNVKDASFVAIDAEMSGLGCKSGTMHPNIDDRYLSLCKGARSHSVISLGVACFKFVTECEDNTENAIKCSSTVYNFVLLCDEPYTIDPSAVKFLIQHGFNFNNQFASGLPYKKGNDKSNFNPSVPSIRGFFSELVRLRKPLVLHNGFTDLIFLYQCFYADCPSKLTAFMADLSEMFPGGIYDTKYVTEFCDHAPASYLLYAYKTACLKNSQCQESGKTYLQIGFSDKSEYSISVPISSSSGNVQNDFTTDVCLKYAAYGWCIHGPSCSKSHDTDEIISFHKSKSGNRKRKRKCRNASQNNEQMNEPPVKVVPEEEKEKNSQPSLRTAKSKGNVTQAHRSGTDSFMTGYTFAVFIASQAKLTAQTDNTASKTVSKSGTDEYSNVIPFLDEALQKTIKNKLYLSGKSIPLQVCKSSFTKSSKNHTDKFIRVYLSK